jgi:toxin ParE1/3/4
MASQIRWTRPAVADLTRNAAYIANESPFYATKVTAEIYQRAEKLKNFPRQGRKIILESSGRELREVNIYSWRVIYEIIQNDIFILKIIHMAQSFDQKDIIGI